MTREQKKTGWRWTKRRQNLRILIGAFGIESTRKKVALGNAAAARVEEWTPAEAACALADWELEIQDVATRMRGLGEEVKP